VTDNQHQTVIPGISLSSNGQAIVDPELTEVLIDIAIAIDDRSRHPVDVQHVVAAIVLAAEQAKTLEEQTGKQSRNQDEKQIERIGLTTKLSASDDSLLAVLAEHVETVFRKFGGKVGADD